MTVLFSGIFNGIELIWDRQFGFLKETLVAPVPRATIMVGRTLGGATTSVMQGLIVAIACLIVGEGIRVHTVNPGFVETEGFPQRNALSSPLARRVVIEPEDVARHVVRSLERGRGETFVPGWFRLFPLLQTLAPGLVGRFASRSGYRDRPISN